MLPLILISDPSPYPNEHEVLEELFSKGLQCLHLRKPDCTRGELYEYIERIPECYHPRLMLHAHHDLLTQYDLRGSHFPERLRPVAAGPTAGDNGRLGVCSTVFHDLKMLQQAQANAYDYVFLSPVFDSISKKDYPAAFNLEELGQELPRIEQQVVALGGVDRKGISLIKGKGFSGAAVCGAVWSAGDPLASFLNLQAEYQQ